MRRLALLLLLAVTAAFAQTNQPFDLVILHGHIIDGTGSPWYQGDLAIREG